MNKIAAFVSVLVSASFLIAGVSLANGKPGSGPSASADQPLDGTERLEHKRAVRAIRSQARRTKAHAAAAGVRPAVPAKLTASAVTMTAISLDWKAASSDATAVRYFTYRDGVRAATTAYSHSTVAKLKCGQRYKFDVTAVSASGRQSATASLSATTASCVTGSAAPPTPATPSTPTPPSTPPATVSSNFTQLLSSDMSQTSEALPHGITYDFAYRPRLAAGLNPGGFSAFTGWGQLYECASGNPQPAARVEIRDIQSWIKSKATGTWKLVQQSASMGGSAYSESFVNNASKTADAYTLPSGSTSVTAGGGYNYHFWPNTARVSIDPNDVAGVITNVRYRLVPGTFDPAKPSPCYVLSMGADYWSALTAQWNQFLTNRDVGIGRFKRVDTNWRTGSMSAGVGSTAPVPSGSSANEYR